MLCAGLALLFLQGPGTQSDIYGAGDDGLDAACAAEAERNGDRDFGMGPRIGVSQHPDWAERGAGSADRQGFGDPFDRHNQAKERAEKQNPQGTGIEAVDHGIYTFRLALRGIV